MNFLEPFASERNRAGWRGVAVLLLLALAPVAYLAAMVLGGRLETGGVTFLPPERMLERAREEARDSQVDVSGWREMLSANFVTDLHAYFDDPRYRALPAEQKRFAAFASARVTFLQGGRWAEVRLRPDGSVLSVRLSPALVPSPRTITEEEARELATAELRRVLAPPASLGLQEAEMLPGDTAEIRRFRWEADFRALPEFRGAFVVDMRGDRALAVREDFTIDQAAVAARTSAVLRTLQTLRAAFFILLACYGLYRFARRSMEKEVATARCAILFGALVLLMLVLVVAHPGLYASGMDPERLGAGFFAVVLLGSVLTFGVQGVVLALSYGGSEGELREIYPGKLTSLDALLTGRWFSANVGSAVVFGLAAAGWALLLELLVEQIFHSQIPRFLTGAALLSYTPQGWLPLLLQQPTIAMFSCTYALLLPLMFANRHVANRGRRRWVIVAMGLVGATISVPTLDVQMPWTLVRVLVFGVLMLTTFWIEDFLAAVVAANLFLVGHAIASLAPLGGEWLGVVRYVATLTALTAAIALAATYRARRWTDEMVRPKYAERLLERLGLQAEVSAAREAQLRLLPTEIPRVPGVRIAASCTPANEVGGDFYDFFPMAQGRLGVLVAEGGSTGLASALTIGLAKGFLLYASERNWAPGETMRRLRPVLTRAVKGNIERLGLAYLVMEATGAVRIARFGSYPKMFEVRPGRAREIELLGLAEADFVGEQSVDLGDAGMLLLVTDGLMERIRQRTGLDLAAWLAQRKATGAESLHGMLVSETGAREADLADDITLVLVERQPLAIALREGVA